MLREDTVKKDNTLFYRPKEYERLVGRLAIHLHTNGGSTSHIIKLLKAAKYNWQLNCFEVDYKVMEEIKSIV